MSRSAATVAVAVALILGVVAFFTLSNPAGGPNLDGPTEAVFSFDPSSVQAIRVSPAEVEQTHIVERSGPGAWRLRTLGAAGLVGEPWPVLPARARGAVRVLSELTAPRDAEAEPTLDDAAAMLEITLAGGETRTLRIGSEAIGGRRRALTDDGRVMYIDASVLDMLTNPGPQGWRDPAALPSVGAETSRIAMETPQGAVALARVQGDWSLRQPVRARASEAAVSELIGGLAGLTATAFLSPQERPAANEMGLDEPDLIIRIETDQRAIDASGEVRIETAQRTLRIGGPADLGGGGRFADTGPGGQALVIDAAGLEAIALNPAAYPSRTAIGSAPADVGMIVIMPTSGADRGFRRTLDGWRRIAEDGSLVQADAEPVRAFLTLLTDRLASDVLLTTPADFAPVATVRLLDLGDAPLERVEIGEVAEGVAMRTGEVTRVYAGASLPALLTQRGDPSSLAGAPGGAEE